MADQRYRYDPMPRAQPSDDGVVIGVVNGTADKRRIGYLTEPQPVTQVMLGPGGTGGTRTGVSDGRTVLGDRCKHFSGGDCTLVKRIVASFDPVISGLPCSSDLPVVSPAL
jgi:hypothetical protein